jgi:hypothetical protein
MKIAKLIDGQLVIDDYWTMFPKTSFSAAGLNEEFYADHDCYKIVNSKPHNGATEMLVGCEPYLEDGVVYTVRVDVRPEPVVQEIQIIVASDNGADTI